MELYGGNMEFTQEGNCVDSGNLESVNICVKDGGAGKFFVIKTKKWSVDNPEDFLRLLKRVEKAFAVEQETSIKE